MVINCNVFATLEIWRFGGLLSSFNDANVETISPPQVSAASAAVPVWSAGSGVLVWLPKTIEKLRKTTE